MKYCINLDYNIAKKIYFPVYDLFSVEFALQLIEEHERIMLRPDSFHYMDGLIYMSDILQQDENNHMFNI